MTAFWKITSISVMTLMIGGAFSSHGMRRTLPLPSHLLKTDESSFGGKGSSPFAHFIHLDGLDFNKAASEGPRRTSPLVVQRALQDSEISIYVKQLICDVYGIQIFKEDASGPHKTFPFSDAGEFFDFLSKAGADKAAFWEFFKDGITQKQ
ncbi:MAG: hypothetical protein LBD15_02045 [Holosporales bacterium]|jgi:hypothetical protein|nr:hypothetical protein [Holosporales bacterium]